MNDLTPTERLALKIQDLQAQLALKDEELFFAKAANARMRALLGWLQEDAEGTAMFCKDALKEAAK